MDEELYNRVYILNNEEIEEFDINENFLGSIFKEDINDKKWWKCKISWEKKELINFIYKYDIFIICF